MLSLLLALGAPALATPAEDLQNILVIELYRLPARALDPYVDSGDVATRARTALALSRLSQAPGRLPRLLTLLGDEQPEVRAAAAFGLGLTAGGAPPLVEALGGEGDPEVRAAIYAALGHRGRAADVPLLLEGLQGGPAEARQAAAALGREGIQGLDAAGQGPVIDALIEQLTRLDVRTREAVAFALARIEPPGGLDARQADLLLRRLDREPDPDVRSRLLRALGRAPADRAAAALAAGRADPDVGARVAAAALAGALGDGEALEALLGDGDWPVRLAAVRAVGEAEGLDYRALLGPALQSGEPDIAAAAVSALGRRGLIEEPRIYLSAAQPLPVQVAAVGTLDSINQLTRIALESPTPALRSAAAARLMALEAGGETLAALLGARDPVIAGAAAATLSERPEADLLGPLLDRMTDDEDFAVWVDGLAALEATLGLEGVRPPEAVRGILDRGLGAREPAVRRAARSLADALGEPRRAPPPHFLYGLPPAEEILAIRSARILTDAGEIRVSLDPEIAPVTVLNFAQLAERDYFDGLHVHRVVPDFVIQDGCPRGDGWGGPGYTIPDELSWLPYDEGTLGMALSGPDTGGSQWFLTLSPQPQLEGSYTAFGRVSLDSGAAGGVRLGTTIRDVIIERVPPER